MQGYICAHNLYIIHYFTCTGISKSQVANHLKRMVWLKVDVCASGASVSYIFDPASIRAQFLFEPGFN